MRLRWTWLGRSRGGFAGDHGPHPVHFQSQPQVLHHHRNTARPRSPSPSLPALQGSPGEQRTQTTSTYLDTRELLQLLEDGFGVPDEDGGHAHLPSRLQVLPDVIQEDDLEIHQREPGSAPQGRATAGLGQGIWVVGRTPHALFWGWWPYLLRFRLQRVQGVSVDLGIWLLCSEPAGLDHQVKVATQQVHQRGREEPPGAVVHPVVGEDTGLKS